MGLRAPFASRSSASAQDLALVVSHDIEPTEADGDALLLAVVVPDQHDLPAGRVGQVELVGADRVALGADPEELPLHGVPVELARDRGCDYFVQRLDQTPARAEAIVRLVLGPVRDPDVHDRWRAQ